MTPGTITGHLELRTVIDWDTHKIEMAWLCVEEGCRICWEKDVRMEPLNKEDIFGCCDGTQFLKAAATASENNSGKRRCL